MPELAPSNPHSGARELLSRATGARVWREHRVVLWLHFLLPPVLAALVVAATFATPPLAALFNVLAAGRFSPDANSTSPQGSP